MVTIKDVARAAGVSPSTASGALRGSGTVKPQTAKKVLAAAEKLEYRVNVSASALRTGRTGVFSLILPSMSIPYYGEMAEALATELAMCGFGLMVQVTQADPETERQLIGRALGSMTDGLFVDVAGLHLDNVKEIVGDSPAVLFESFGSTNPIDAVNTPTDDALEHVIGYLKDCGYERIGIVGKPGNADGNQALSAGGLLRYTRYRAACRALEEFSLVDDSRSYVCDWGVGAGIAIAHELAAKPFECDVLVCMNDDIALGLIRGFHECGVNVPGDVGVMGFDGIGQGSYSVPSLSTVNVDRRGLAHAAVSMMMRQMSDEPGRSLMPQRVSVGFQLLTRESTRQRIA